MAHLLYVLKSAGAAFRSPLAQVLQDFGYKSSKVEEIRGLSLSNLGQCEPDNQHQRRWLEFVLPDKEQSEQGLRSLGLRSLRNLGQPNVWLQRKATKDDGFEYYDDGFEYYEMLFVYVEDILALMHHRADHCGFE